MSGVPTRVVVTDHTFPDLGRERSAAQDNGAEFFDHQCTTADEVTEAVAGAQVALVQFAAVTADAIDAMPKGAGIIRYGIGYDNIDVAVAQRRGVQVGYVPDYCTDEVSDHTASLVLASLRRLPQLDASVRAGQWDAVGVARPLLSFDDTTVGFLGLGRIGGAVLKRLRGFGFRFLVADPQLGPGAAAELGVTVVDQGILFAQSDVVSLHVPATPQTNHIVNAASLATMKPHAVIVNTARGKLIDEDALADALIARSIGGAALDVFETEPLALDHVLRTAPNVLLSPHSAWYSDAAIVRLQELVAQDVGRLLRGDGPRCPVPGSST